MQAYSEVADENYKMSKFRANKPLRNTNNVFSPQTFQHLDNSECPVMSRAQTREQPRLTGKEANDNSIIFFFPKLDK